MRSNSDTTIRGSTIAFNSTLTDDGGGLWTNTSPVTLHGTILANNEAGDEGNDLATYTDPLTSEFTLIGDTTQPGTVPIDDGGGNLFDVDPNLKPLKNNGGPTDTHAIKKSPARTQVPSPTRRSKTSAARRARASRDIGAYELAKCEGVIVNRVGTRARTSSRGPRRRTACSASAATTS